MLTVAVVTGRQLEDTTYRAWYYRWRDFMLEHGQFHPDKKLRHAQRQIPAPFWTALSNTFTTYPLRRIDTRKGPMFDLGHTAFYQRQTLPSHKMNFHFVQREDTVGLHQPVIAHPDETQPDGAPFHERHFIDNRERRRNVAYGCTDKNSAIISAPPDTTALLMMDDCCFPLPGLCEIADNVCAAGDILLINYYRIRVLDSPPYFDFSFNNSWDHPVFGIWAMPLEYILDVNGFNMELDGLRGQLDVELWHRVKLYAESRDIKFRRHPKAAVFEIEHSMPWGDHSRAALQTFSKGHRANNYDINLRDARERYHAGQASY